MGHACPAFGRGKVEIFYRDVLGKCLQSRILSEPGRYEHGQRPVDAVHYVPQLRNVVRGRRVEKHAVGQQVVFRLQY